MGGVLFPCVAEGIGILFIFYKPKVILLYYKI